MDIERAPIDVQNDARDLAPRRVARWHQACEIGDHMLIIITGEHWIGREIGDIEDRGFGLAVLRFAVLGLDYQSASRLFRWSR